jgi:hypothetical protein
VPEPGAVATADDDFDARGGEGVGGSDGSGGDPVPAHLFTYAVKT